jgi:L-alanine-DL-glutamate epimerase-like enolase superfamily enzyme
MNLHVETADSETVYARDLEVSVYTIPTSSPESDGTAEWDSTTLVLVTIHGADRIGLGYTYAASAAADVISKMLKPLIEGENAMDIPALHRRMVGAIRNQGTGGLAMMAVSAVDTALWDLKAKILNVPLWRLLGAVKESMLVYGSGGFTSYNTAQLQRQLGRWAEEDFACLKMKIGRDASKDAERVSLARDAIGADAQLFVDANGAYTVKQAVEMAHRFAEFKVSWFEEPVVAEDHTGLRFIREHLPAAMSVAGGEYASTLPTFRHMLEDGTVDILQADATRCGGITGFLKAGHLAEAFCIPFSSHCAPMLHLSAGLALPSFYIGEYFYDHARIESMLFDGFAEPRRGFMHPDLTRPGLGIEFKYQDAAPYQR